MKVGLISNSEFCLPLAGFLVNSQANVYLYLGNSRVYNPSHDMVRQYCANMQVPVEVENDKNDLYPWLKRTDPDIVFIIGYRHVIKLKHLAPVRGGIYNVHFGSLPQFRGPNPVFWALKSGAKTIGLCIHQLTDKLDTGNIAWEKEITNEPHYTYTFLHQMFSNTLVEGAFFIINSLMTGIPLPLKKQDERLAHYYYQPELKDVVIKWATYSAEEIIHLIRACNNWNTGASTQFGGMEVKLADAVILDETTEDGVVPGTILEAADRLIVSCKNNKKIRVFTVTMNGVYIPERYAAHYGLMAGSRFTES